ncbi:TetR/AcrR family transcriptional regulator [Bacillus sp. REN3]|uniref:TetR/AcrR family transcriptional regulator n=1 Tax=Bacillus sp. REN3 TaxID=2802440 RepID=UPI001AED37B1|nr:TetR/AcrR family transcriptional regulator [Bacillus sp. REN3]
MNERKRHVLNTAHQLFIEKGFQSTSIQDILEYSGISKGTFYNYFSSKNELLIEIFKTIFKKIDIERNELLIGEDPSDPEIFTRQIELQMKTNRENKLIPLFEEVYFSNDEELKHFLKTVQLKTIRWIYERLTELSDEGMKPYLLDAAIMFIGILQQNTRYYTMAHGENTGLQEVVRYSVSRIKAIAKEASQSGEQLFQPLLLEKWLPAAELDNHDFRKRLCKEVSALKTSSDMASRELLDFIQDELLHSTAPRKAILDSMILSLSHSGKTDISHLEDLIKEYFEQRN